jgi:hypothetical protein
MDTTEAVAVLEEQLVLFTQRGYAQLAAIVDRPQGAQAQGRSGATYNIEFNVVDDDGTNLRIIGSIDDGTRRTFMLPLTRTKIMNPTGALV